VSTDLLSEARRLLDEGDRGGAAAVLARVAADPTRTSAWAAADRLHGRLRSDDGATPWARRSVRLALLASHTSGQLASALRVAALAHGIALEVHEAPYHAYEQEIADPVSGTYTFRPDVVLLAVDQREVRLPEVAGDPDEAVRREADRWRSHWELLRSRLPALVLQTSFVPPAHDALGDVALRTPGSRRRMLRRLNDELAVGGPVGTYLVDAEAVAAEVGADTWSEPRYWFAAKQAVGPGAVPVLAQRVLDVLVGALGLGRKVLALDLDNTLWGGVVGEDGLGGIVLGNGPAGEAFAAFQAYLVSLRQRGLLLAVCSKNNPADARLPFERHPEMRMHLDDVVAFEASWDTKPEALRRIAKQLDVGLDSLVLVDDNPAEREIVRQLLPQVGVVELPQQPSGYVRAVASFPGLQSAGLTADDARRTEQYHARQQAADLEGRAATREDFLASLDMTARIEPLDEVNLRRVVQLIGKTNQLNLTGRRHGAAEVLDLAARPRRPRARRCARRRPGGRRPGDRHVPPLVPRAGPHGGARHARRAARVGAAERAYPGARRADPDRPQRTGAADPPGGGLQPGRTASRRGPCVAVVAARRNVPRGGVSVRRLDRPRRSSRRGRRRGAVHDDGGGVTWTRSSWA
jgi:FkbH-like protein